MLSCLNNPKTASYASCERSHITGYKFTSHVTRSSITFIKKASLRLIHSTLPVYSLSSALKYPVAIADLLGYTLLSYFPMQFTVWHSLTLSRIRLRAFPVLFATPIKWCSIPSYMCRSCCFVDAASEVTHESVFTFTTIDTMDDGRLGWCYSERISQKCSLRTPIVWLPTI